MSDSYFYTRIMSTLSHSVKNRTMTMINTANSGKDKNTMNAISAALS